MQIGIILFLFTLEKLKSIASIKDHIKTYAQKDL